MGIWRWEMEAEETSHTHLCPSPAHLHRLWSQVLQQREGFRVGSRTPINAPVVWEDRSSTHETSLPSSPALQCWGVTQSLPAVGFGGGTGERSTTRAGARRWWREVCQVTGGPRTEREAQRGRHQGWAPCALDSGTRQRDWPR